MPTGPEHIEAIAEATGAPLRNVKHLARRLGEMGLIPRGPRGVNAPHFDAIHSVRLLLGLMTVADGIAATSAGVVRAVERIGGMVGKRASYMTAEDEIVIAPAGPFADALAHIVDEMRGTTVIEPFGNPARKFTSRVGIIFGRHVTYAYIDLGPDGERETRVPYTRTGDTWRRADDTGLVRKCHINGQILRRLADLLGEKRAGAEGTQSVR